MSAAPLGSVLANEMSSSRANRLIVSSLRVARSLSAESAPMMTSGIFAPAGTFISVRTERISETRRTIQLISSAAALS